MRISRSVTIVCTAILIISAFPVRAATSFAAPAFKVQWQIGEAVAPNFWGPLSSARDGVNEPYKEAHGGQRIVQYYDKTRMELTDPANGSVTNGLLTTELITGKMQVGDSSFETRQPAQINIAGDSGTDGPTYADLAPLPALSPSVVNGGVLPIWHYAGSGRFDTLTYADPLSKPVKDALSFTQRSYLQDPGGRYGQHVFGPFETYLRGLLLPLDQTTGYAITPFFIAQVKVGGVPTTVVAQAFERRVLTYNPNNPDAFKVEFGNIGLHYYQWRYPNGPAAASMTQAPPPVSSDTSSDFRPFAERWGSHGFSLTVDGRGNGIALSRAYKSCNDNSSPPCDTFYNAMASLTFSRTDGVVAYGTVTQSVASSGFETGDDVSLTLLPYGMAVLSRHGAGPHPLCGPNYGRLAPADLIKSGPCGA